MISKLPERWDELNARRHFLIDKGIHRTMGEDIELKGLQNLAGEVREFLTPPLDKNLTL
jgi:hypothetical protein